MHQCNLRPDMTRNPRVGYKSGLFLNPHRCIYCDRIYYADEMATPGADRPCPALLRLVLQDVEEEREVLRLALTQCAVHATRVTSGRDQPTVQDGTNSRHSTEFLKHVPDEVAAAIKMAGDIVRAVLT